MVNTWACEDGEMKRQRQETGEREWERGTCHSHRHVKWVCERVDMCKKKVSIGCTKEKWRGKRREENAYALVNWKYRNKGEIVDIRLCTFHMMLISPVLWKHQSSINMDLRAEWERRVWWSCFHLLLFTHMRVNKKRKDEKFARGKEDVDEEERRGRYVNRVTLNQIPVSVFVKEVTLSLSLSCSLIFLCKLKLLHSSRRLFLQNQISG